MVHYFSNFPLLLQYFISPIESLYFSTAFAQTMMHGLLILLLARYILIFSEQKIYFNSSLVSLLFAAILVAPFFQIGYLNQVMGIVPAAPTYAFFYALPLAGILLWFLPFFRQLKTGQKISKLQYVFQFALLLILPFSGALITGVASIICGGTLLLLFISAKEKDILGRLKAIPTSIFFFYTMMILLSLYSLYIGKNNLESSSEGIPLLERYARLPWGIIYYFKIKLGLSLLLISVLIEVFLIRKLRTLQSRNFLNIGKFLFAFSIIYVLLLPLGGYREYRSHIIRPDTFAPVILSMIFCFGLFSFYLMNHYKGKIRKIFVGFVLVILTYFTISDEPHFHSNTCEKEALQTISETKEEPVIISDDCLVISWVKDGSLLATDVKSRFLEKINITEGS
ncbi:MAG: hypothetical protein ACI85O_002722 [Saprospiraceae bacterium]|jgi:hypothetical protein